QRTGGGGLGAGADAMRILRAGGFERVAGHDQQGQGGAETGTRARGPGADDVRHAKSPQSRDLSGSQKAFSGKSFSQRDSTQRADVGKPQSWTVRARIRVEVGRRRRLSRAGRRNYRASRGEPWENLIECETHRGFHTSLGRGCGPCTRIEKTRKSAQRIFSRLRDG